MQIVLIFLSFFVILYWLFELAQSSLIIPFSPFFEPIKNFVHLFYNRTVSYDGGSVDFSFLIATFIFLLIVWGLRFVIEGIELLEKKYDKLFYLTKRTEEKIFNASLESSYSRKETKKNNFIFFVNLSMLNLAKNKLYSRDFNEGSDEKREQVLAEFFNNIDLEGVNKKIIKEGVLLNFFGSDHIDYILSFVENLILKLRAKYSQEKWQLSYLVIVETYVDKNDFLQTVNDILGLNKINLQNRIVCFATFKQRYLLNNDPQFNIETEGVYTINNQEKDVFLIKT